MLIEEFLAREHDAGRLQLPLSALPQKRALLHGHCHQKAFDAMQPAVDRAEARARTSPSRSSNRAAAAWREASATRPRTSTCRCGWRSCRCCPPCAARTPDTLIVADGTSCRHQIADGTRATGRREAVHVVRVLAAALTEPAAAGAGPV